MITPTEQLNIETDSYDQIISDLIPKAVTVLGDINKLNAVLYAAFDESSTALFEFLRGQEKVEDKKKIDKWLSSPLMRYLVQSYLHKEDINALFDDDYKSEPPDWKKDILQNNGLRGSFNGYQYRILKAINGNLPPAGHSKTRKEYYCQKHLYQPYLIPPTDSSNNHQHPNIVILWEFIDSAIKLYLSVPRWGNEIKAIAYYTEPIEHPVTTYKFDLSESVAEETEETIEITMKGENVIRENTDTANNIRKQDYPGS